MLCPESPEAPEHDEGILQQETKIKEKKHLKENRNVPVEGSSGGIDFSSFGNPKTWKRTISSFFRNQGRSTRSNDGDLPSVSNEQFSEEGSLSREQKWQSLGKMFRRPQLGEHSSHTGHQEDHPNKKSASVRKVWSQYFGKHPKSPPPVNEPDDKKNLS